MRTVLLWGSPALELIASALRRQPGLDLVVVADRQALIANLGAADALIVSAAHVTPDLAAPLQHAPRLRWIQLTNAGYDNVAAMKLGDRIALTYVPGAGSRTVAEHGLCLMLALARRLPQMLASQREGRWDYGPAACTSTLGGKTILIVGFGHVGRAVAELARAFGMTVVAVSRSASEDAAADAYCTLAEMDRHLPTDFVLISAALNSQTRGLFGASRLGRIGPRGFLVNLSRGALVDTQALNEALRSGALGGAALDVTEPEPLPASHPLWTAPRLILTPHTASSGLSQRDQRHLTERVVENVRRFMEGATLLHRVGADAHRQ